MSLESFFESIKSGLAKITGYIAIAINILTQFNAIMPNVVTYIIAAVLSFLPKIAAGEITGPEARESIVTDVLNKFHGSGDTLMQEDVRTIVDQVVKLEKAKRDSAAIEEKERLATERGYLVREEIERAIKAWPGLMPVNRETDSQR